MIEKVSLFNSKRDFFLFFILSSFILFYSLLIEYNEYKKFTRFDSQIINATVVKQYSKTKDSKTLQILKLKSESGLNFYTSSKKQLKNLLEKRVSIKIYGGKISFYQYLTYFYAYTKIKFIYEDKTLKESVRAR